MYKLLIGDHGRQRWIERVVDPKRYKHLSICKIPNCEECKSLMFDIRNVIKTLGHRIDSQISGAFLEARDAGRKVTDVSFIEAIRRKEILRDELDFYLTNRKGTVIAVTRNDPPVLVTILSNDMIDGTVIRNNDRDSMKTVFQRWKYEARRRGLQG
jgi:hypothetical protein